MLDESPSDVDTDEDEDHSPKQAQMIRMFHSVSSCTLKNELKIEHDNHNEESENNSDHQSQNNEG